MHQHSEVTTVHRQPKPWRHPSTSATSSSRPRCCCSCSSVEWLSLGRSRTTLLHIPRPSTGFEVSDVMLLCDGPHVPPHRSVTTPSSRWNGHATGCVGALDVPLSRTHSLNTNAFITLTPFCTDDCRFESSTRITEFAPSTIGQCHKLMSTRRPNERSTMPRGCSSNCPLGK